MANRGKGQYNEKEQPKMALCPTPEKINEIIDKFKVLIIKMTDFRSKKSAIPITKVSDITESLYGISKLRPKQEVKESVSKLIDLSNKCNILKMEREGNWPKEIQQLMNDIEMLSFPYRNYFRQKGTSGKWEQSSFEFFVRQGEPSKLENMVQELEKIKYKIEVETQLSAETKQYNETEQPSGYVKDQKEPSEIRVARVIREHPYLKSKDIAKLAGIDGKNPSGTVRGTTAWKNRKDFWNEKVANKGKKTVSDTKSDIEVIVDAPKPEHQDINGMIQGFQLGNRKQYPTPEEIAEKLSTPEDPISELRAKELLKETEHIFGY